MGRPIGQKHNTNKEGLIVGFDSCIIYIHWPFAEYYNPNALRVRKYHASVLKEIILWSKRLKASKKKIISAVYFGTSRAGSYPPCLLLDTVDILKKEFIFSFSTEITLEVNAHCAGKIDHSLYRRIGVNRLNIVVGHLYGTDSEKTEYLPSFIRSASQSFINIGLDLTLNFSAAFESASKRVITTMLSECITHVTCNFDEQALSCGVNENIIAYEWLVSQLQTLSFNQYSLFQFARPYYHSRYMIAYWNRHEMIGIGASAESLHSDSRCYNESDPLQYIKLMQENDSAVTIRDHLTQYHIFLEKLMLGIRRGKEIIINDLILELQSEQRIFFLNQLQLLVEKGFLSLENGYIAVTKMGMSLECTIIETLLS